MTFVLVLRVDEGSSIDLVRGVMCNVHEPWLVVAEATLEAPASPGTIRVDSRHPLTFSLQRLQKQQRTSFILTWCKPSLSHFDNGFV